MTISQQIGVSNAFAHGQEIRGMMGIHEKTDSKSGGGNIVLVRVRPGAPIGFMRVRKACRVGY
jgi:hypothetical protein